MCNLMLTFETKVDANVDKQILRMSLNSIYILIFMVRIVEMQTYTCLCSHGPTKTIYGAPDKAHGRLGFMLHGECLEVAHVDDETTHWQSVTVKKLIIFQHIDLVGYIEDDGTLQRNNCSVTHPTQPVVSSTRNCNDMICLHGGRCEPYPHPHCVCKGHWSGGQCQYCGNTPCENARCVIAKSINPVCVCDHGYVGGLCDTVQNDCDGHVIGGYCYSNYTLDDANHGIFCHKDVCPPSTTCLVIPMIVVDIFCPCSKEDPYCGCQPNNAKNIDGVCKNLSFFNETRN